MNTEQFFDNITTVRLSADRRAVDIIDQTLLPGTVRRVLLRDKEAMHHAIKSLMVRGAPAIGVFAAYGIAVCMGNECTEEYDIFLSDFKDTEEYLASARPTAVNLTWALQRMANVVLADRNLPVCRIKELLYNEADAICREDIAVSRSIGETGFRLLSEIKERKGSAPGILTHCNAGSLATARYGTATAPMYIALEHGWSGSDIHVYCDETRPLLQGSRLTAFELSHAGITTTLQCDNMASSLMQSGKIDIIFTGCDRVAANGDLANKIGTSSLAILAGYYGIPFYVCAPSSTVDLCTKTGSDIPIEHRDGGEITEMWYKERMAPCGIEIFNPAFDITDHSLVTGIITEFGLCTEPFEKAFKDAGI